MRSVKGSTRLEAKKQRRRDGREAGRRRPPILTEAEFLARREAVDRVMVVRQRGDRTQIAVLEDGVLVEHYVSTAPAARSLVGNVYLGRVQNVLPRMEAAFVDIGKGRNAVLYAGEVNWDAAGLEGQPRAHRARAEVRRLGAGAGHQGPDRPQGRPADQPDLACPAATWSTCPSGSMTGISRKLPDTERTRLKAILKKVVPGGRRRDRAHRRRGRQRGGARPRRRAAAGAVGGHREEGRRPRRAPALLYGEPDLAIRVVRDIFNEDFTKLVVAGDDAWDDGRGVRRARRPGPAPTG